MEFLVNIKLQWTPNMDETLKQQVITDERSHAAVLIEKGHLVRMWRVPCRFENWGVWRAKSATELHQIISGLPAFPWMSDVAVTPLAKHPVDPSDYEV
ncbi:muconolactone Delta-isomerase [Glaciimonas sp. PCH181]|uniref:muconolactone Delta-isomerase n=1 Tax=Glaciimonas sp. PCH181 TaxID=2133943 RepID=UPI000D336144|nr:muconolactone Delta-isomerase family protein [Glaciimonas sp. PCH181]PUA18633.1 muconolactone delta-isomerase [Glaciimonas sp. PCH181]